MNMKIYIWMAVYIWVNEWIYSHFLYVTENQTTKLLIAVQCDEYNDGDKYWMLRIHRGKNLNQSIGVFQAPSLETED